MQSERSPQKTGAITSSGQKSDLEPDKSSWEPSLLVDQMVLISSSSSQGVHHAARKSWLTMVRDDPPMLGICCRLSHRTAINILETREFVVNIPGDNLARRVWEAGDGVSPQIGHGPQVEWTWLPSRRIAAPRVAECLGHLECLLDSTKRLGGEDMIFFARIVAASIDASLREGTRDERYGRFKPLLYLGEDLFTTPGLPRTLDE